MAAFLTIVLLLARVSNAGKAEDMVDGKSLPWWNQELPSKIYSGFLPIENTQKQLHYVLVESEKEPASDPLVLWLNGGPGCSSLEGFFYEHGPFTVADAHAPPNINFAGDASANAGESDKLVRNPWSWSRAANVLYIEAPAGVGFSFSPDKSDLKTGDNQTAADNLAALESFFGRFPEFQSNPFYVSGESYGGVYVPTLSQKIYQAGSSFKGNMKGYLVGNGVFDDVDSRPTHVPFLFGHGFVSTTLYDKILSTCDPTFYNISKECEVLIDQIEEPPRMNGYDAYRTCYSPPSDSAAQHLQQRPRLSKRLKMSRLELARSLRGGAGESVPCINSVLGTQYLNRADVRASLHVESSPNTWAICGGVNYIDDGVYDSMVAVHEDMIKQYKPRVLVYNGDVDPGCNYLWGEASCRRFGGQVSSAWHSWTYDDKLVGTQLGGYAIEFEKDVTFTTIHGAGHMSPQWRPEAVFNMLSRFLNGERL